MTQNELKRKMYTLVSEYFTGAAVTWGKVKIVSPNAPQVVLTMLPVVRSYHPVAYDNKGVPVNSWPSKTTLQVDLYTKGANTNDAENVRAAYENTAVNDLSAFLNFLGSPYVDDWGLVNDISIHAREIHDLSDVINDAAWQYRAMAEVELGFTESAAGYTGISWESGTAYWPNGRPKYDEDGSPIDPEGKPMPGPPGPLPFAPTPSGGGSQELADQYIGWFEAVDGPEHEKE